MKEPSTPGFSAPIRPPENVLPGFFYSLGVATQAGVPLLQSLQILATGAEHPTLRRLSEGLAQRIEGGSTLSSAMTNALDLPSKTVLLSLLKAAEDSGQLPQMLLRIYQYLEADLKLRRTLRQASVYPIVLLLTFVVLLAALIFWAGPFLQILEGVTHPLTRFVVWEVQFVNSHWHMLLPLLFAPFLLRRPRVAALVKQLTARLPLWGDIQLWYGISRFALLLRVYLESGLNILEGLGVALTAIDHPEISVKVRQRILQEIQDGTPLPDALRAHTSLPGLVAAYFDTAEEVGKQTAICEHLERIAEFEVGLRIRQFSSLLDPLVLALIGFFVGFHALAFMLGIQQLIPL